MNDKSPIKITCRIINLIIYTLTTFTLGFFIITEAYKEFDFFYNTYNSPIKSLLICTIPLIIMMIISLIIKYSTQDKSKVNIYRVFDTLVRIICTIPISITAAYYILEYTKFDNIIKALMTIAIFYIINGIMKFTLQETLNVSFIIHDEL